MDEKTYNTNRSIDLKSLIGGNEKEIFKNKGI